MLNNPSVAATSQTSPPITHLFLVGGFAESPVVQDAIRDEFRYAYEAVNYFPTNVFKDVKKIHKGKIFNSCLIAPELYTGFS